MLADQVDYVVGVDPHRDSHALAIVHVLSGAVVFEATIAASSQGYAEALQFVDARRRWLRHGKEPSTRSAPDSLSYAIC